MRKSPRPLVVAVIVSGFVWAGVATAWVAAPGCVTYNEDLNRGERHFQANEYERALALWRALETDMDSFSPADRTRYAYLRGMTDYRMSYRADARHWLSLARAFEKESPGGLEDAWKDRIAQALKDLDSDVYGGAETSATAGSSPPDSGAASSPAFRD